MPSDAPASEIVRRFTRFGLRTAAGLVLTLLFVSFLPGCGIPTTVRALCGPYEECKRMEALRLAAALQAKRVWIDCYREQYPEESASTAFRQGFETAFVETVVGGTGCPPPVPSRPLLSWQTLTFSYPDADDWYAGYHLGHASALANGIDRWRLAPIDPSLRGVDTVGDRGSVIRIPDVAASHLDEPSAYDDDPENGSRRVVPSESIELLVPPAEPESRGSQIDL